MAVLPKKYLSVYDVADYLNELGYEYDLNQSFDRYKLNKDIYEFVLHNQIKLVYKALSINFTSDYIVLLEYQAKAILIEDNITSAGGSSCLIYQHEDGSYPKTGNERTSIEYQQINLDSIYIPRVELDNLFKNDISQQLIIAKAEITDLETELAQVKAQLKEQIDNPANAEIDEGQGDTLLILGAVMDCIKEVAKPNYTQGLLINAITDKYKNTSSLTQSTLTKKFPKAKTHLKQNVTS
ncbi:hypothetical protein QJS82_06850 [Psychrobacter maritimus]|uniref:hypothetical protein n=1 Tax=Psychrobacter maritimus TaxID=256325 RepID=UPI00248B9D9D|nr:hypothetical protein [Psychrobacter sp. WB2]WGV11945.1 hypothetical protein QJS82_06850 [Psychrobacter sp. WB2]